MGPGRPTSDEAEERKLVMIGMTRRIKESGYHPHCTGCPKKSHCAIPADPLSKTIVECEERPGTLFEDYKRRRGL